MKLFKCNNCQSPVFFENTLCINCGHSLGYLSEYTDVVALVKENGNWQLVPDDGRLYKYCSNFQYGVCNWLVPIDHPSGFCEACALNRTIPNLSVHGKPGDITYISWIR